MKIQQILLAALLALGLPACATITTGTNQSIAVATVPAGAACNVTRHGELIGSVPRTPGSVTISKSGHDIAVDCAGPGGSAGAAVIPAGMQAATLGNILIGGLVGYAVDLGTGAASEYPRGVRIWMDGPEQAPVNSGRPAGTYFHHPNRTRRH
jgi:hypothetical protein